MDLDLISILLIAGLVLIYTVQSLVTRYYSASYPGRADLASPVFTIVSGLVVALVTLAVNGFRFDCSLPTLLLALCNALAIVLYNTSLIKASATGPYSITMVFLIAGGIIIPTIVEQFYGFNLNVVKVLSILVVLVSVYLVARKDGETAENKSAFFGACLLIAIGNGAYGSFLNVQQEIAEAEKEEMVILTYLFGALLSAVILLAKEKKNFFSAMKQSKRSLAFLVAASLVVAFAINVFVFIIAYMKSHGDGITVLYTLDNSLVFLLSVAFSCIFMKERLSRLNVIGCITLCAALVCITNSEWIIEKCTTLFRYACTYLI